MSAEILLHRHTIIRILIVPPKGSRLRNDPKVEVGRRPSLLEAHEFADAVVHGQPPPVLGDGARHLFLMRGGQVRSASRCVGYLESGSCSPVRDGGAGGAAVVHELVRGREVKNYTTVTVAVDPNVVWNIVAVVVIVVDARADHQAFYQGSLMQLRLIIIFFLTELIPIKVIRIRRRVRQDVCVLKAMICHSLDEEIWITPNSRAPLDAIQRLRAKTSG